MSLLDLPALAALRHTNGAHISPYIRLRDPSASGLLRYLVDSHVRGKAGQQWDGVVLCGETLVGHVTLMPVKKARPGCREIVVWIAEAWCGAGIGRTAVAQVCRRAQTKGFTEVWARVRITNGASRARFVSCGFTLAEDDHPYDLAAEDWLVFVWRPRSLLG